MWNFALNFPFALSLVDLLILILIMVSCTLLFFKFPLENFRWIFGGIVLLGLAIIVVTPIIIPSFLIEQVLKLGIVGLLVLWAIDIVLPPYPTTEIFIVAPLVYFLGLPFLFAEAIAIGFGILILLAFYPSVQIIYSALVQGFQITLFSWILTAAWLIVAFIGVEMWRKSRTTG